jgi:hypothetical protein
MCKIGLPSSGRYSHLLVLVWSGIEKNNYIHFFGKEMDSKMLTVTAPVNSLEAILILVV